MGSAHAEYLAWTLALQDEGREAFLAGKSEADCPYPDDVRQATAHRHWMRAFRRAAASEPRSEP